MRFNRLQVAAVGMLAALACASVFADEIPEIVVTATKRAENINDVPISIVAASADTLEKSGVEGTDQLSLVAPGLNMTRTSNQSLVYLRGVGTSIASAGNEPSVALYVDDVYNPSPNTSILDFNNVERVEVLKGPQGTLFGRNATGGLIHIITQDPSQETSMKGSLTYGDYQTAKANFYATTGVTANVAADLAVLYSEQGEGYVRNTTVGGDTSQEKENASVRSKWLFTPTDDTTLKVVGSYVKLISSLGQATQPRPGTTSIAGTTYSGNWYQLTNNVPPLANNETWGASANFQQVLQPFDFISITGYQHDKIHYQVDQDGTPYPIINAPVDQGLRSVTEELRLVSKPSKLGNWILGAYYFNTSSDYDPLALTGTGLGGLPGIDIYDTILSKSYALFGEGHWNVGEDTGITTGARWTRDKINQSGNTIFVGLPPAYQPPNYAQNVQFSVPTWRLGADHHFDEHTMGYATYSRGYKSGGFNSVVTGGVPAAAVKPETLDAYEVGVKTDLLDRSIHIDASAFYYKYKDLQVTVVIPGGNENLNAARSTIKGLDYSMQWYPMSALTFNLGAEFLHAKYDSFPNGPLLPALPGGGDDASAKGSLAGQDLVHAPRVSADTAATYQIPTSIGKLGATVSYSFNSGFAWDSNNRVREPAYSLVNSEVSWKSVDNRYGVKIWGHNLFQQEYAIWSYSSAYGDLYAPAPPRTVGITAEFSYK